MSRRSPPSCAIMPEADHRTRMQGLSTRRWRSSPPRYPDDKEAAILSALVTSANFNPTDKTYTNQLKAARILEPLFESDPDHPGVAHYLIHSYDYPPIAKHGVEAAKALCTIAPDAAHALHMPSHIFTRLGYWQEFDRGEPRIGASAGDATFDAPPCLRLHGLCPSAAGAGSRPAGHGGSRSA